MPPQLLYFGDKTWGYGLWSGITMVKEGVVSNGKMRRGFSANTWTMGISLKVSVFLRERDLVRNYILDLRLIANLVCTHDETNPCFEELTFDSISLGCGNLFEKQIQIHGSKYIGSPFYIPI